MSKETKDFVTKEVLVAYQSLDIGIRQNVAKLLKSGWADLVERDIDLLEGGRLSKTLGKQNHSLVTDHVTFDVQRL